MRHDEIYDVVSGARTKAGTEADSSEFAGCATPANTLTKAQAAISRMAKAHKNGKGVRLTWEELDDFSRSLIGEWFEEDNPCEAE